MALALDGSAHGTSPNSLTGTATLTTTSSNDIIVVIVQGNDGPITGVSGSTLGAFTRRGGVTAGSQALDVWYKIAASPVTSEVITATQTVSNFMSLDAFGVSGANTVSPFDGTIVTANSDPVSISTTNANTLIFGSFGEGSVASPTSGAGWTQLSGANFQLTEYKIVSSTQSSLTVNQTTGAGDAALALADAIVAGGGGGGSPPFAMSLIFM